MDVAAAVVGFVGLSGQVLQGCNYLCDFFADVKDAPNVVQNISDNLEVIQPTLTTLRTAFEDLQGSTSTPILHLQDPIPGLKICESAIAELKAFVDSHNGAKTKLRRGWQRLDVARKANKLRGFAVRLEQAKTSLLLIQANIDFAMGKRQLTLAQDVKLAQEQLRDAHSTSAQVSSETKAIALGFRADMQAGLGRLNTLEQYARDTKASSRVTENAICSLSADFSRQLGGLSTVMAPIIEIAVVNALAQHTASVQGAERVAISDAPLSGPDDQTRLPTTNSTDQLHSDTSMVLRSHRSFDIQGISAPESSECKPTPPFTAFVAKRGPKRQRRDTTTVNLWFGRIQITTAVTEQEEHAGASDIDPLRLSAKTTRISLFPNMWFLKTGACFQFGDSKPGICHPAWDNRLRIFRTHSYESRVWQVIEQADYVQFRQMLQDGEVTVHDMVGHQSLFEAVTHEVYDISPYREPLKRLESFLYIAQLLASSVSDIGSGRSLYYSMLALDARSTEALRDRIRSLCRLIISQSESDPFNEACVLLPLQKATQSFTTLALHQEEWDLSDFIQAFQKRWGKDSWNCSITMKEPTQRSDFTQTWQQEQERRWLQLPLSLRQNKEHCLQEFGEEFIERHWPLLYWRDQRPSFWRSREECQKLFGDDFIIYNWPKLYWEVEVPPFWDSKEECQKLFGDYFIQYDWGKLYWRRKRPAFWYSWEACLEFFGKHFVELTWPEQLQERSFDHVEGQGAWQYGLDIMWDRVYWGGDRRTRWKALMSDSWLSEEQDLRHSRKHSIEQYGTNFVREDLPRLLKEFDKLSDDEITKLTQDGPDLVPPSPISSPADSESSDSDDEAEERKEEEDGWETAEED